MQLGSNHYSQRDIYDLVVHPFPNFKDSGERPGENISPQYEPILDSYILATSERVFYIAMLFVVPVINTLITSSCQMKLTDIGIYIKTMASEAIYRKALVLTSTAKGETSTGQLVNIMSSDTNMVLHFFFLFLILLAASLHYASQHGDFHPNLSSSLHFLRRSTDRQDHMDRSRHLRNHAPPPVLRQHRLASHPHPQHACRRRAREAHQRNSHV